MFFSGLVKGRMHDVDQVHANHLTRFVTKEFCRSLIGHHIIAETIHRHNAYRCILDDGTEHFLAVIQFVHKLVFANNQRQDT